MQLLPGSDTRGTPCDRCEDSGTRKVSTDCEQRAMRCRNQSITSKNRRNSAIHAGFDHIFVPRCDKQHSYRDGGRDVASNTQGAQLPQRLVDFTGGAARQTIATHARRRPTGQCWRLLRAAGRRPPLPSVMRLDLASHSGFKKLSCKRMQGAISYLRVSTLPQAPIQHRERLDKRIV